MPPPGQSDHGDPLPLPQWPCQLSTVKEHRRYLVQRQRRCASQERRLREGVASVNSLFGDASSRSSAKSCQFSSASTTQRCALESLKSRVSLFPRDPVVRSDREALEALLKTRDLYQMSTLKLAPFSAEHLKFLRGVAPPRELAERLRGHSLELYKNHRRDIERSPQEIEALHVAGELPHIVPYWDPILKHSRTIRRDCSAVFVRLASAGFGGGSVLLSGCFALKRRMAGGA